MVKDYQTILNDFLEHLSKSGRRSYSDFYIGTTDNVNQRMFVEHNVSKEKAWWIYRTANSSDEAYRVEQYFLEKGMRGKKNDSDTPNCIVYCYAVSPTTVDK